MRSKPQQLNLLQAELNKAHGLAVTSDSNPHWLADAVDVARRELPYGVEIMGEQINAIVFARIGGPSSEKAWGAFMHRLKFLRIIEGTGRYAKSRGTGNHAHKYEIYVRPI